MGEKKTATIKGELKGGIYTVKNVELTNGAKIDVEVITDPTKLPITFGTYMAEGNGMALILASLTVKTRRMLEFMGGVQADFEIISPIIEAARDAAEAEEK